MIVESTREYLEAYAEGVNFARDQRKKLLPDVQGMSKWTLLRKVIRTVIPSQFHQPIGDFLGSNWEFFLAGYDDSDPWTIRDSLVIFKLLGYVGLADTQILTEKVIYRAIHAGIPVEKLQLAFPNLNGLSSSLSRISFSHLFLQRFLFVRSFLKDLKKKRKKGQKLTKQSSNHG